MHIRGLLFEWHKSQVNEKSDIAFSYVIFKKAHNNEELWMFQVIPAVLKGYTAQSVSKLSPSRTQEMSDGVDVLCTMVQ